MPAENGHSDRIGTRQHYVPQFLLRNFTDAEGKLWAFDKHTDCVFRASPANVAAECGFYDYCDSEGRTDTFETATGQLDDQAAVVIHNLLAKRNLDTLSAKQRYILAAFAAAQLVRTATLRASIQHMTEQLTGKFRRWAEAVQKRVDAGDFEPPFSESTGGGMSLEQLEQFSEDDGRLMSLKLIQDSVTQYAAILLQKRWFLAAAPAVAPFYCSDNPLVLHNERRVPFGGLGIGQKDIQIYLPLSSNLTFCMFCPELAQEFRDIESAIPLDIPEACVQFQNSLQVNYAERFVLCERDDFELARKILTDHPECRDGPRGSVA